MQWYPILRDLCKIEADKYRDDTLKNKLHSAHEDLSMLGLHLYVVRIAYIIPCCHTHAEDNQESRINPIVLGDDESQDYHELHD